MIQKIIHTLLESLPKAKNDPISFEYEINITEITTNNVPALFIIYITKNCILIYVL